MKKEAQDTNSDVNALKHASAASQESNKTLHEEIGALQISLKHNKANINKLIYDATSVNGGWGNWTYISECSLSCGGGIRYRLRMCDSPSPRFGGKWCSGNDTEMLSCNTEACPGRPTHFHYNRRL